MGQWDELVNDIAFIGYAHQCMRQDQIEEAIEMFHSGYDIEDEWDCQYVLNHCDLDDLTNEEGEYIASKC